jgi:hypothetical protein
VPASAVLSGAFKALPWPEMHAARTSSAWALQCRFTALSKSIQEGQTAKRVGSKMWVGKFCLVVILAQNGHRASDKCKGGFRIASGA